jgi:hypothetical protein
MNIGIEWFLLHHDLALGYGNQNIRELRVAGPAVKDI